MKESKQKEIQTIQLHLFKVQKHTELIGGKEVKILGNIS